MKRPTRARWVGVRPASTKRPGTHRRSTQGLASGTTEVSATVTSSPDEVGDRNRNEELATALGAVQGEQPPELGADLVRPAHRMEGAAGDPVDAQHVTGAVATIDPKGRVLAVVKGSEAGHLDRIAGQRLEGQLPGGRDLAPVTKRGEGLHRSRTYDGAGSVPASTRHRFSS
jgi:hypothetical protein